MHAEERVGGVGHRVDEAPHQVGPLRDQPPVLAPERHDGRAGLVAGQAGHPVGLQAGADDHPVGRQLAGRAGDHHLGAGADRSSVTSKSEPDVELGRHGLRPPW